MIVGSPARVK